MRFKDREGASQREGEVRRNRMERKRMGCGDRDKAEPEPTAQGENGDAVRSCQSAAVQLNLIDVVLGGDCQGG